MKKGSREPFNILLRLEIKWMFSSSFAGIGRRKTVALASEVLYITQRECVLVIQKGPRVFLSLRIQATKSSMRNLNRD